ncbi:MAG: sn-glycerol-3-phosphate ABC transporter ATP-binding protein UgpC [Rubrivivax sp.]|jgi:multiple sugar transport system ATP-binding protein
MVMVGYEGVRKRFGPVEVLKGIDLAVQRGEFVVLVGPSGCGKSTLLRLTAGLDTVSDGRVTIDGRIANDLPPQERDIAMVFQSYALYPHMTVGNNMGFALKMRGQPAADIAQRVQAAALTLGLDELLDRLPKELSGGQRQRVAMGRAVVRAPRVFLFDEPLSNLDAKLRVHTRIEVRELHDRLGATSIYVTHDQVEAMTLADRIVVMHDGVIQQAGPPLALYDRPDNLFVAGFIGSPPMNLYDGRIEGQEGNSLRVALDLGGHLAAAASTGPTPAGAHAVVAGVRAEDLRLENESPALRCRVRAIEQLGHESHVHALMGSTRICLTTRERTTLRPGDTIGLSVAPERVHLFDRASGRRL